MKRLIAAVLCMTMVAAITGCGNSENESDGVSKTETGDKPESISVICTTDEEGLYEYVGEKYEEMYGIKGNRQIMMRPDIKLPQPFASWSNSL